MKTTDVYRLLAQAVRFSKEKVKSYEQLQTFAVVRSESDWNSENLGKTILNRFKPYFYSRKWEALGFNPDRVVFEYPALFLIEQSGSIESMFSAGRKECTSIQLSCLYPNVEKLEDQSLKAVCENLLTEEIYDLTKVLLYASLQYLYSCVYAITDVNPSPDWYNKHYLDYLINEEKAVTYTIQEKETNSFKKQIELDNQSIQLAFIDDQGKDKLCGVTVNLKLCSQRCDVFDYDFIDTNCCAER